MERKVAAIYRSLPPEEQAHTAIVTTNYGEAAALDVYGVADGLPPALCGQNQYFLWGDHGYDGRVIIHINGDPNVGAAGAKGLRRSADLASLTRCHLKMNGRSLFAEDYAELSTKSGTG